ncbi:hypothetical protein [Streptomyces sp. NPDC001296]
MTFSGVALWLAGPDLRDQVRQPRPLLEGRVLKRASDVGRNRGRQFAESTGLDHRSWTAQRASGRLPEDARRAWNDLAEATPTLPLAPDDRERIAEAVAPLLHTGPDFNGARCRRHALSTNPHRPDTPTDHAPVLF